jgi:GNAT superfamily N-acetyltransferase
VWHNQCGMTLAVLNETYDAPVVQTLVQEMADDLAHFYGPGSYPQQDPSRWSPPHGDVLVAYLDRVPAACGGLIRFDDRTAELKRMFTRPQYRRRGLASELLTALEHRARQLGYQRVVLETGVPQVQARALYEKAGYTRIPCWCPHDTDPTSVCFGRDITDIGDSAPGNSL